MQRLTAIEENVQIKQCNKKMQSYGQLALASIEAGAVVSS